MSPLKEVDFFAGEINWGRGLTGTAAVLRRGSRTLAIGEASTSYTKYPEYTGVPDRIARPSRTSG